MGKSYKCHTHEFKLFRDTLAYESELNKFREILKGDSYSQVLYPILEFNFIHVDHISAFEELGEVLVCPPKHAPQSMEELTHYLNTVLYGVYKAITGDVGDDELSEKSSI